MATVQAYTKAGVDAKFNSRSNMTIVHSGGGTPDIAAFPDAKTGDIIERSGDGARWSVLARNLTPVAGRVVSDSSGRATVATPTSAGHAATKGYVDNLVGAIEPWVGTQAQYDAITSKNPSRLYVIT